MNPFVWTIRVYWEDTDAGGVVYHSQYANFFERARTEWLRSLGVHQAELAAEMNTVFVVRRMEIDFTRAARLDDELDVTVHSVELGGAKMVLKQEITRRADGERIASAMLIIGCLKANSFKPTRVPGPIRARIIDGT